MRLSIYDVPWMLLESLATFPEGASPRAKRSCRAQ